MASKLMNFRSVLTNPKCDSSIPKPSVREESKTIELTDEDKLSDFSDEKSSLVTVTASGLTRGKGKATTISLPPPLNPTPVCHHTFAFSPGNSSGYSVTVQGLMNMCGGIVTVVNSTFSPWASSIKIKKITIWPPAQGGDYAVSDVWWANGYSSAIPDMELIRPVPADITITAPTVFKPPKRSLASDWINANGSGAVFVVQSNVGSVVYIDVTFTLSNLNQAATQAIASGVLGTKYYLSPDPATFQLRPIALATTH